MKKRTYTYNGRTHKGYNDTISFFHIDDDNNEFRFEFDIDEKRDEKLIEYVENYNWEYTIKQLELLKSSDWTDVPNFDDAYITKLELLNILIRYQYRINVGKGTTTYFHDARKEVM